MRSYGERQEAGLYCDKGAIAERQDSCKQGRWESWQELGHQFPLYTQERGRGEQEGEACDETVACHGLINNGMASRRAAEGGERKQGNDAQHDVGGASG